MNETIEYRFSAGRKEYVVKRSDKLLRRTYNMNTFRGHPWMTYSGTDRIEGDGIIKPALYSQADSLGRQYLFSIGPWWVDANHSHPGYGYLSLVFIALLRPDQMQEMSFNPTLSYPTMRNMKIAGKIRGNSIDLKGADLVFWFQCYSDKIGKKVNYALIGQTLNDKLINGKINDFELDIDVSDTNNWICLGSCIEKSYIYGELPIGEVDTDKPINMGFILIPLDVKPIWPDELNSVSPMNLSPDSMWPVDTSLLPAGAIALYELEVDYYSNYQVLLDRL